MNHKMMTAECSFKSRLLLTLFLLAGLSLSFMPGFGASVAQAQFSSSTERLLDLHDNLVTQYTLFGQAHNTERYTAKVNGRIFDASTRVARDEDFKDHDQLARDAYNRASAAYSRRDAWTGERELRIFKEEIQKMNSIGWYKTLHKMRTSSDQDVQQRAYDNGYRDNKTWEQWHDRYVLPKTKLNRLWTPDLNSSGGAANFGPAPDFSDSW